MLAALLFLQGLLLFPAFIVDWWFFATRGCRRESTRLQVILLGLLSLPAIIVAWWFFGTTASRCDSRRLSVDLEKQLHNTDSLRHKVRTAIIGTLSVLTWMYLIAFLGHWNLHLAAEQRGAEFYNRLCEDHKGDGHLLEYVTNVLQEYPADTDLKNRLRSLVNELYPDSKPDTFSRLLRPEQAVQPKQAVQPERTMSSGLAGASKGSGHFHSVPAGQHEILNSTREAIPDYLASGVHQRPSGCSSGHKDKA